MTDVARSSGAETGLPDDRGQGHGSAVDEQLEIEQRYVTGLYDRLDELRREKADELARVRRTDMGTGHQSRSERDAFATHYEDRLAQLEAVDKRLAFGRLDTTETGEASTRYIGRIGLATEDHRRLLVDWRAREAAAFYQATGRSPWACAAVAT